jgi:hypothetical protein
MPISAMGILFHNKTETTIHLYYAMLRVNNNKYLISIEH